MKVSASVGLARYGVSFRTKGSKVVLGITLLFLILVLLSFIYDTTLTPEEAEGMVRNEYSRRIGATLLEAPLGEGARLDRKLAELVARELREVTEMRIHSVKVKRALLEIPLFARRRYYVEVRRAESSAPEYFRINVSIAYETSSFWWYLPL